MMKRRICIAAIAAIALSIARAPARAADAPCSLVLLATLPLETHPRGNVSVPASVNGKPVTLAVDTGSFISALGFSTATSLQLPLNARAGLGSYENDVPVLFYVQTDTFQLGPTSGNGLQFFVVPSHFLGPGVSGLLGPDIMKNFDIELDFAGGKFNLFAPNTCPAPPVYWTHEPFAEVAMKLDRDWKVVVPALLDGRPVTVILDTGASRSLMSFSQAQGLFGWQEGDPNLKGLNIDINGRPASVYRYRFSTLTFDGIEVAYPDIDMAQGKNFDDHGRDDAQIVLGMSVLRQLHPYIAYKAQKLYLTAAEAR